MVLWCAATAVVCVYLVFDSVGIDYRVVALGGVLPLAEDLSGSPWVLHTLAGGVVVLAAVMGLTVRRRLLRRRWLGLAVGVLMFLVFSGSWTRAGLFWWPTSGFDTIGTGTPPELDRPVAVILGLEGAGVVALLWLARVCGLDRPEIRRVFLQSGRLPARGPRRAAQ